MYVTAYSLIVIKAMGVGHCSELGKLAMQQK